MEKRKAKRGLTARLMVSIILIPMGIGYITVGALAGTFKVDGDVDYFRFIFCATGAALLITGVICLCTDIRKRVVGNRLINSGQYIMAEISEIVMNHAIRVNGRHPYVIVCRYQDMYGNIHTFRSRGLYFDPEPLLRDRMVRVYVDGESFKHYYVDIDAVLPEVIQH